jgi:HK97 family phage major capsid protein
MTLKEQLAEKKSALKALEENIKAGDEEAIAQGEEIAEAIKGLEASITAAEKASALLAQIGKDAEPTEEETDMEAAKARTLGENFINHIKSMEIGKRFDVTAPSFKAATDTQASPVAAVDWATTFDRNVVTGVRTPLVIRDLFGAETISGSTLQYLVEGAIQGAPAVTAEGATKPQVHFADPTPVTVALKKIACHIKESDEYIDDYPFLASAINGRLLYELGLVEQNTLVTDLLGTSGIQTGTYAANATAAAIADEILKAAMDVQNGSGFAADAIVINPADWYVLRVGKDGENRYYGGGYFGDQSIPTLWGIQVCVSTAVTAGTIVVGAFKTCGSVVSKGGVSVESTNSNEDDFEKNLMTIRAEERLALAVRRPAGFKKLTKAS